MGPKVIRVVRFPTPPRRKASAREATVNYWRAIYAPLIVLEAMTRRAAPAFRAGMDFARFVVDSR